jgi:hypothetical protein
MSEVIQDTLGYYQKDKWFFFDECGLENGPFNSKEQAQAAEAAYIKYEIEWEEPTPIRKMKDDMGL